MFPTRGYTLIELLVVIAIISILAGLLFPVFAAARDKARQTSCLSNEKQLGLAVQQYITDFDEVYPISGMYGQYFSEVPRSYNVVNYPGVGWAGIIFPYIKSDQVFACPSDPTPGPYVVSYAYNQNLSTSNPTIYPPLPQTVPLLTAPASTVMYFETYGNSVHEPPSTEKPEYPGGWTWSPGGNGQQIADSLSADGVLTQCETGWMGTIPNGYGTLDYTCENTGTSTLPNTKVNGPTGVHFGGSNFAFADGHAKWLPGSDISPGWTPTSKTAREGATSPGCLRGDHCAAGTEGMASGVVGTFSTL